MSVLNPGERGDSHNWNYTKPENPGYSLELTGTVAAIQEVQAMNFGADGRPTTPKFWENGQPVWNIRMVLVGPSGGFRTWTFPPAGKAAREGKKKSVHLDLFALAGGKAMTDLIGKTIHVSTIAPPAGFNYGLGNPRPWAVELVEPAGCPYQLKEPLPAIYQMAQVLGDGAVSGGVMQPPAGTVAAAVGVTQPAPTAAPAPQAAPAPVVDDEDIPF